MIDPIGRREVMNVIGELNRKEGMTVIMITHFMEEALLADRIIVMDKGKILTEGGREVFEREKLLNAAGLDIPALLKIRNKLRDKGFEIGGEIKTCPQLVDAICRSL